MENETPPLTEQQLREAFQLFSETSARLSETYAELQGQVARLSAELAAANGELARRERLSVMGEVAAKLAHQLRTPLATALLYVGHLARPSVADADRIRFADKTLGRLRYLERLIQDMLAFVKGQQGQRTVLSVSELVDEVWQAVEPQAALLELKLELEKPDQDERIEADRQAVQGALINLLENAIQASPPGGRVVFSVTTGGAFVAFRVSDQGRGIAETDRARLFEPFYTTRSEGSGLGLAIVKQTADGHGGWVEIETEPRQGSQFALFLPVAGKPASSGGTRGGETNV